MRVPSVGGGDAPRFDISEGVGGFGEMNSTCNECGGHVLRRVNRR